MKNPVFNDAGETAFLGRVDGVVASPTGQGIWSEGGGDGLALVALSGDPAPDTPDGGDFYYFRDPTINNAGRTAFTGYVSWGLRHGIWAEDRYGGLTLIALTGELLDVDDGPGTDFRTISKLNFHRKVPEFIWSPVDPTPQSGFNDLGQVVFYAEFTDGSSGIFVSNLVAVPEPAAAGLLLFALLSAGMLFRR